MKLEGSDLGFYGPEVRKKEELIKLSYLILSYLVNGEGWGLEKDSEMNMNF